MLSISDVSELLSRISEEKKISFDKNYAEKLYESFNMFMCPTAILVAAITIPCKTYIDKLLLPKYSIIVFLFRFLNTSTISIIPNIDVIIL